MDAGIGDCGNEERSGRMMLEAENTDAHGSRIACRNLRRWFNQLGLPYHSLNKFKHGHAIYGLKLVKDIVGLKAISQNLMHSNLSITDGVYGVLSDNDIKKRINGLNSKTNLVELGEIRQLIKLNKNLIDRLGIIR